MKNICWDPPCTVRNIPAFLLSAQQSFFFKLLWQLILDCADSQGALFQDALLNNRSFKL
jgi:hypothetical protein